MDGVSPGIPPGAHARARDVRGPLATSPYGVRHANRGRLPPSRAAPADLDRRRGQPSVGGPPGWLSIFTRAAARLALDGCRRAVAIRAARLVDGGGWVSG